MQEIYCTSVASTPKALTLALFSSAILKNAFSVGAVFIIHLYLIQ